MVVCQHHTGMSGGFNSGFPSLHYETWMWNSKILMGPSGLKIHYSPKQGLRQAFQNAVPHKAVLKTVISLWYETPLGIGRPLAYSRLSLPFLSVAQHIGRCTQAWHCTVHPFLFKTTIFVSK